MSRRNPISARLPLASPVPSRLDYLSRTPNGLPGFGRADVSQLVERMKNQAATSMGLIGSLEDSSILAEDVEGVSDAISKLKGALRDFGGYEIKTVKTTVGYNGQNVPGYEIRVVMRLVSSQGKSIAGPSQQDMTAQANEALARLKSMDPQQLKALIEKAQAELGGQPPQQEHTP